MAKKRLMKEDLTVSMVKDEGVLLAGTRLAAGMSHAEEAYKKLKALQDSLEQLRG